MKHVASYKVRVTEPTRTQRVAFEDTVRIYRDAVSFLIGVVDERWDDISAIESTLDRKRVLELLVHATAKNPEPAYPEFDGMFYKFPSYLRRAACSDAIGKVASHRSNLERWEESGRAGGMPKLSFDHFDFPVLYRGNMYERTGGLTCRVKVFERGDWIWEELRLRRSDARYLDGIAERGGDISSPALERRGRTWALRFAVERDAPLTDTPEHARRVCAVDLGINKCATMVAMEPDGTVIGRSFFDMPVEKDRLSTALGRIRKAQRNGAGRMPRMWAYADNVNSAIAKRTARAIVDFAVLYSCDAIVFEYLDMEGRVSGPAKQRLALWRKREVQQVAASQAHLAGIRVSRVCAWGTSRLAFDGSGRVERGSRAGLASHSLCRFPTGKIYDCDLNAAYNIAARYLVRAKLETLPETVRLGIEAKVPGCARRTTCTLSSLISLDAELAAMSA